MRLDIAKPTFFRRGLIAWLLAVGMLHAHADAIVGRVVSVADGDTIVVLDSERVRSAHHVAHRMRRGRDRVGTTPSPTPRRPRAKSSTSSIAGKRRASAADALPSAPSRAARCGVV